MRNFKVTLDDPAWKVLPAALKKYKINNDDWQNYAMFICYGNTGQLEPHSGTYSGWLIWIGLCLFAERCLSYDEKPLLLFQKLKDAKKNPVFMLKHIRDIRSPIAVAQQKQAARSKEKEKNSEKERALVAPPLQVKSKSERERGGWADGIMSPGAEPPSAGIADFTTGGRAGVALNTADPSHGGVAQPLANVSYAIAIYPYHAEQEDEFDVAVYVVLVSADPSRVLTSIPSNSNDTFIILSRAKGWWVVQRDPTGSGHLDPDQSKQGWVPAGCLLETSQPVEIAIQEAISAQIDAGGDQSVDSTPILPSSIVSTSYPGIALMEYRKKGGEEELDLTKDDMLRVFKRYNHWSYVSSSYQLVFAPCGLVILTTSCPQAVKETNGERGWVPSWFIGKIGSGSSSSSHLPSSSSGLQPPSAQGNGSSALDGTELRYAQDGSGGGGAGLGVGNSPVSPGFGAIQMATTSTLPTAPPGTGRPAVAMI